MPLAKERKDLWADLPIYGGMVREDYIRKKLCPVLRFSFSFWSLLKN